MRERKYRPASYHNNLGCWNCKFRQYSGFVGYHCLKIIGAVPNLDDLDREVSDEQWELEVAMFNDSIVEAQGHCDEWKRDDFK